MQILSWVGIFEFIPIDKSLHCDSGSGKGRKVCKNYWGEWDSYPWRFLSASFVGYRYVMVWWNQSTSSEGVWHSTHTKFVRTAENPAVSQNGKKKLYSEELWALNGFPACFATQQTTTSVCCVRPLPIRSLQRLGWFNWLGTSWGVKTIVLYGCTWFVPQAI